MNAEKLMKQLGIDKENKGKIEEITKYMEEHRIQELFNVTNMHHWPFYRKFWRTFWTTALLMQNSTSSSVWRTSSVSQLTMTLRAVHFISSPRAPS